MRRLCATVLIFEAIVIGLAIPVAITIEHEPRLWQGVAGAQARVGDEEREGSPEQPDQEHRAPEPGLVVVPVVLPHKALVGRRGPADKGRMRILLVSDLHYTLKQLDWVSSAPSECRV